MYYLYDQENADSNIYKDPISLKKIEKTNSDFVFLIIPVELLIPIAEIKKHFHNEAGQIFKISNAFVLDVLFVEAFSKMLDIQLLVMNKGKFNEVECSRYINLANYDSLVNEILQVNNVVMNGGAVPINNCFLLN